jgi:sulfide:quinone oxidoreductase
MGDEAVRRSALSATTWTSSRRNKHTLQSPVYPDVFMIGDATNLPASKAGSVAHFESETLADNVMLPHRGQAT